MWPFSSPPSARKNIETLLKLGKKGRLGPLEGLAVLSLNTTTSFDPVDIFDPSNSNSSQMRSDSCLLELACFAHARLDFLLFTRSEALRGKCVPAMFSVLNRAFTGLHGLTEQKISAILNNRLSVYGPLFASGPDAQKLHDRLAIALQVAILSDIPALKMPDVLPSPEALFKHMSLMMNLQRWDIVELQFISGVVEDMIQN